MCNSLIKAKYPKWPNIYYIYASKLVMRQRNLRRSNNSNACRDERCSQSLFWSLNLFPITNVITHLCTDHDSWPLHTTPLVHCIGDIVVFSWAVKEKHKRRLMETSQATAADKSGALLSCARGLAVPPKIWIISLFLFLFVSSLTTRLYLCLLNHAFRWNMLANCTSLIGYKVVCL